ncbi:MAG: DUF885 domain-containing protein [Steroidobacteraceae bacterium]
MLRRHCLALLMLPLMLAGAGLAPAADAQPSSIDAFFKDFTDAWVRRNPNLAISSAYFTGKEQDRLSRELTPLTRQRQLDNIRIARAGLEQLGTFDPNAMTPAQRTSADVMRWQLQSIIDNEPYLDYDFPLQQFSGANVNLPNALVVTHPVKTPRDAENYIARLKQVDDRMHEATATSRRQAAAGILPPRFILEATIRQMQQFIEPEPAGNPLAAEFDRKLADVSDLAPARRAELTRQASETVRREVYPAWKKAIATLQSQLSKATDSAGLSRFANGAALYALQLRRQNTTNLTPQEIHDIGLREVARIEGEMDALFRKLGYTEGTIAERVNRLSAELAYPNDDAGRKQIMEDIEGLLAKALQRTTTSFDVRPKAAVIARPYPEFRWASAAASYTGPPLDGSRPGIFQIPLRPGYMTKFGLPTLIFHETVPGHHFHIALVNENTALPAFRRVSALGGFAASVEGWALYAERFAAEDGWYEGDIAGLLGQLNGALFRARRLVVDTGLHALSWTRQQAIDFGIEASEVERYVVIPGQATSYMIGQLEIVKLRDRARAALGDRFSIREFHNVVLGAGIVPLSLLGTIVDQYIARTLGATATPAA